MPSPPFGTASAYSDSFPSAPPRQVTINAETCYNLNVFRDMVRQYRKLDDQVIIRLNRASAQLRDQNRAGPSRRSATTAPTDAMDGTDGMCVRMWGEMMAGWAHRQTLLSYCISNVQNSAQAKRAGSQGVDDRLAATPIPSPSQGWTRGAREEEALAEQLANEEGVEAIIRKRTLDAFKSRCPFFQPAATDQAGRAWWDLAESARRGKGPDLP